MFFTQPQLEIIYYCLSQYSEMLGNNSCNDLNKEEIELLKNANIKIRDANDFTLPHYIMKLINSYEIINKETDERK